MCKANLPANHPTCMFTCIPEACHGGLAPVSPVLCMATSAKGQFETKVRKLGGVKLRRVCAVPAPDTAFLPACLPV